MIAHSHRPALVSVVITRALLGHDAVLQRQTNDVGDHCLAPQLYGRMERWLSAYLQTAWREALAEVPYLTQFSSLEEPFLI